MKLYANPFFLSKLTLLTVILCACQHPMKSFEAVKPVPIPGMSAFELAWVMGRPKLIRDGINEKLFIYDDGVWILRNGRASHWVDRNVPTVALSADSLRRGEMRQSLVFIKPKRVEDQRDIYFSRYSELLARALEAQGVKVTADEKRADALVLYSFSINESKTQEIDSVPITTVDFTWNSPVKSVGETRFDVFSFKSGYEGTVQARTIGSYGPSSSYTVRQNQRIVSKTKIDYNSQLQVEVVPIEAVRRGESVASWQVTVQASGHLRDKRKLVSTLSVMTSNLWAQDTQGEFSYLVSINDPMIAYIQGNDGAINHLRNPAKHLLDGFKFDFTDINTLKLFNEEGQNPACFAASLGLPETINLLERLGDFNQTDAYGKPVLAYAVDSKSRDLVKGLISRGANPHKKFEVSRTSYDSPRVSVIEYARERGLRDLM